MCLSIMHQWVSPSHQEVLLSSEKYPIHLSYEDSASDSSAIEGEDTFDVALKCGPAGDGCNLNIRGDISPDKNSQVLDGATLAYHILIITFTALTMEALNKLSDRGQSGDAGAMNGGSSNNILNVAILLDITASMGNQIDGVKRMIAEYCQQENDTSILRLHIFTFTESSKKSYVSHFTSSDSSRLKEYVDNIKLSRPPDFPSEEAHGADQPENILHGLAVLRTKIPLNEAIVCFVITDACIHFSSDSSSTTRREREALEAMGFGPNGNGGTWDGFVMLNEITAQHGGKLLLIPLLYGYFDDIDWHWHCQAAALTGGCVLRSKDSGATAKHLATGMRLIVRGIYEARGGGGTTVNNISQSEWDEIGKTFDFFNLSEVELLEAEPSSSGRLGQRSGDSEPPPTIVSCNRMEMVSAQQSLMGLFHTCVNIEGRKFKKRLKNVKVATALYSAQFVCHLARLFVDQYSKESGFHNEGDEKESGDDVKKTYLLGLEIIKQLEDEYKEVFGTFLRKTFAIHNDKISTSEKRSDSDVTAGVVSVHLNMSQIIESCEVGLCDHPTLRDNVKESAGVSKSSIVSLETIQGACDALPVTLDQSMQGVFESLATIGDKIASVDDSKNIADEADVKKIASDLQKVQKDLEEIDYRKIDVAQDLMGALLQLIHVLLVDIRFPTDPTTKQPDFYDSYSTQINDVGISVLTAHDAMMLKTETGNDKEFRDPQIQTRSFNAALPLVYLNDNKQNDVFAKFIFQLMSSLPLLDQITTYLISGDPNIFPSINSGVLASLAYHVFNNQESGFVKPVVKNQTEEYKKDKQLISWMQNNLMDSILNSLESQSKPVAGKMIREMKRFGQLNPKDAIPQLFAGIYWLWKKEAKMKENSDEKSTYLRKNYDRILRFLIEEWVTAQIQKHDRYNNHIYKGAANVDWLKNPSAKMKENKEYKEINPSNTVQNLFLRPEAVMDWHTFVSKMEHDFIPDDLTSNMHVLEILHFKRILDNKLEKSEDKTISLGSKLVNYSYFGKLYLKDKWEKHAEQDLAKGHQRIFNRVKSGLLKFLEFYFADRIEVSKNIGSESNSVSEQQNGIASESVVNSLFANFETVFLQSWMLKKRAQRYELRNVASSTQPLHRRLDDTKLPHLCEFIIDYLREIWSDRLWELRIQRDTQVKSQLEQNIADFISLNSNIESSQLSSDTCRKFLEENVIVLTDLGKQLKTFLMGLKLEKIETLDSDSKVKFNKTVDGIISEMFTYRLDRNDIIPLLKKYAASKKPVLVQLIRELILGDSWTTVPPILLKSHSQLFKTEIFASFLDNTNNQTIKEEIELLQKEVEEVLKSRPISELRKEIDKESGVMDCSIAGCFDLHAKVLDPRLEFARFFGKALLAAKSDALLMLQSDSKAKGFKKDYRENSSDHSFLFHYESYDSCSNILHSAIIDDKYNTKMEDEKKAVVKFLNYSIPGGGSKTGRDYLDNVIVTLINYTEEPIEGERTLKRKIICMREFISICQFNLDLSVDKTFQLIQYVHFRKPTNRLKKSVNKILKKVQQKRWKW